MTQGKICKQVNLHLPKKFFKQAGLPRKVDIPIEMPLEENQLIIGSSKPKAFLKEKAKEKAYTSISRIRKQLL